MCKKYGSTSYVKHGFVRGFQRCRCKTCGFHFTATPKRHRSEATRPCWSCFIASERPVFAGWENCLASLGVLKKPGFLRHKLLKIGAHIQETSRRIWKYLASEYPYATC